MSSKPVISNAMLYDLETQFLQQRALDVQRFLEQSESEISNDSDMSISHSRRDQLQLEPYRCEAGIIKTYLDDPDRKEAKLGEMLGKQLRKLNKRQMKLTSGSHNYSDAYWQNELERTVTTEILNDWWEWLLLNGGADDTGSFLHTTD